MVLDKVIDTIKTKVTADTSDEDIVELILEDHKPLKEFIVIMKDVEQPLDKRREAAENFAVQLVAHAKPEELVLYAQMKKVEELKIEAFEGETEHSLADQMLEEIKRVTDDDVWSAKVKVLAELVEHHIEEEENDILPDVRKKMKLSLRERMGEQFLDEKSKMLEVGADDAPPETTADLH
jgi:hemerythrin superfamily protein